MFESRSHALKLMTDTTRAVWIDGNSSALHGFFHDTATISGVLPDVDPTVADYCVIAEQLRLALTIEDFEITNCVCGEDGEVAYHMVMHTTMVATGTSAPQAFANFCRFEGDKVIRSRVLTDQLSFFERAGMICPSQRLTLLAG